MSERDIRPEWDDYSPWQAAPRWVAVLTDLAGLVVVGAVCIVALTVWRR